MSNVSAQRALSAEEKRKLVAKLLQKARAKSYSYPLSHGQQAMWFVYQSAPQSAAYNMVEALEIESEINAARLEQAWQQVVDRHPALRCRYLENEGIPYQEVQSQQRAWLEEIDATGWGSEALTEAIIKASRRPFDLETGPVWRLSLFSKSPKNHTLLLTVHHIAGDAQSMQMVVEELLALAGREGAKEVKLPPLPSSHATYVKWERDFLDTAHGKELGSYWHQQLSGLTPVLNLPTDYARPPVQTYNGASITFDLSWGLTEELKSLATSTAVTLYVLLLAAFEVLLHRYSGQTDIAIGTPTAAARNERRFSRVVGYLINMVVIRSSISDASLSFNDLLKEVQQRVFGALAHQQYPFALLVQALQPVRDPSRSPLFQTVFTLREDNHRVWEGGISRINIPQMEGQFDLSLDIIEQNQTLKATLSYNADLFSQATIKRMASHLEVLLKGIVKRPAVAIRELPWLTAAEEQQLLVEWNNTKTDYPRHQSIHRLFEAQAERTPEAVAVMFAATGQQLTYRALNERANQLAHYLVGQGVGPETLVGLCVSRSLEMIVGILAILKAGGAYVPLDIAYPSERLAFMLSDTAISVLLTFDALRSKFPQTVTTLGLDSAAEMLATQPVENLKSAVTADNLAYIMYTSGSTGRPKGVCVTQRNVVRLVQNTNFAQLSEQEVFLQFAPISFDASTLEIWGALLNGGRLVVMSPGQPTLSELGQTIREHGITTLWLTAGLFHLMVDERLEDLRPLRQLLAGGDVLSVAHVQKVLANLPNCKLINGYGPTENTTFTCCFPMRRHASVANQKADQIGASVPIGRPIANTKVYILDDALQPVPVGVAGELYAGGDGVARGYHNRPELTAERFILNPYGAGHLYKTGDLVRWLPDGNIEFLGRIDTQVKIRGFRIELGEIETLFSQHPQVRDVLVIVRQDTPGEKQLVAYLLPEGPYAPTPSELRQFGQASLPDYMVPSAFVTLDRFPLNPNGKIDRRALPAPLLSSWQQETFVAPRTPTEERLADLWFQLLNVEPIGINDDFFDLGGHSLLATQLISRIRTTFEIELPLQALFESSTIAMLSEWITEIQARQDINVAPTIDDDLRDQDPDQDEDEEEGEL